MYNLSLFFPFPTSPIFASEQLLGSFQIPFPLILKRIGFNFSVEPGHQDGMDDEDKQTSEPDMANMNSFHIIFQFQCHHQPQINRQRGYQMVPYYPGYNSTPILLLEGFHFRDDQIDAKQFPHVVLVSDYSIESNEVEHHESVAKEQRPFFDQHETNH